MHRKLGAELSLELWADGEPSFLSLTGQAGFYIKDEVTPQI
jgi:hypothetical protein